MDQLVRWVGPTGVSIPATAKLASEIVDYAVGLKPSEQKRVVDALENNLFDMGAEFVWRRAMTRLRQTIGGLGMDFVAEMLGRTDLDDSSSAEAALTDVDTIRVAEQLGVVSETGAMKLRHAFETLSHHSRANVEEEFTYHDAVLIVRACVQYALGEKDLQVAVNFSRFRQSLVTQTLAPSAAELDQLAGSPPFFLSTAVRALLAAIRVEKGARLQHALNNANAVLPIVWPNLPEADKWAVGSAYAAATTSGRLDAVADLKRALLKVKGFDYVPESLRSVTYRRAAQAVIDAHFSFGNFEGEVKPTRLLASLGTAIPKAAVPEAMRAFLLVYIGNRYGYSFAAAAIAKDQLVALSATTWEYFFSVVLGSADDLLDALAEEKPATRLIELVPQLNLPKAPASLSPNTSRMVAAAQEGQEALVIRLAKDLKKAYKGG